MLLVLSPFGIASICKAKCCVWCSSTASTEGPRRLLYVGAGSSPSLGSVRGGGGTPRPTIVIKACTAVNCRDEGVGAFGTS